MNPVLHTPPAHPKDRHEAWEVWNHQICKALGDDDPKSMDDAVERLLTGALSAAIALSRALHPADQSALADARVQTRFALLLRPGAVS